MKSIFIATIILTMSTIAFAKSDPSAPPTPTPDPNFTVRELMMPDDIEGFQKIVQDNCIDDDTSHLKVVFCTCMAAAATKNLRALHLVYVDEVENHMAEIFPNKKQTDVCTQATKRAAKK